MMINWQDDVYTGWPASSWQLEYMGYDEDNDYRYAIEKSDNAYTLFFVIKTGYPYQKRVKWDYILNEYDEDGSEIGYALYAISDFSTLEQAKYFALQHQIENIGKDEYEIADEIYKKNENTQLMFSNNLTYEPWLPHEIVELNSDEVLFVRDRKVNI